jgi:hypothetical protein
VTKENVNAIVSEGARRLDRKAVLDWIEESGERGYFLRDPNSPLDCHMFQPEVFYDMYIFNSSNDATALFRNVMKK